MTVYLFQLRQKHQRKPFPQPPTSSASSLFPTTPTSSSPGVTTPLSSLPDLALPGAEGEGGRRLERTRSGSPVKVTVKVCVSLKSAKPALSNRDSAKWEFTYFHFSINSVRDSL